jgi:protein-tyrosine phosphatase
MRCRFNLALILASALVVPMAPTASLSARPMAAAPAHERVLPLQGGRNFRELGGYPAAGSKHVQWGKLYRSGSMTALTSEDYAALEKRGIRVVCDFRSTAERKAEPAHWPHAGLPKVLADDYDMDNGQFLPKGDPRSITAEQIRATMAAAYPRLLVQFNSQYRRMFAELLAGHAPLAFNCSAGKDRTGIAAALLLTALGVPRETVVADYMLSNQTLDPAKLMAGRAMANSPFAALPPEALKLLVGVDRSYIEAVLAVVEGHQGGTAGYLKDELGLGPVEIKRLRQLYLTR